MKLHVFPPSPNARKVQLVDQHLGTGCEIVFVNLAGGDEARAGIRAINPMGRMPILEDGDFVLWESNAICQYLCSKAAEQDLWPADPQRQADVLRWLFWQSAHWGPACAIFTFERVAKPVTGQGEPDEAEIARGEELFAVIGPALDQALASNEFVAGDLSIADYSIGSFLTYGAVAGIPFREYPNISRWFDQLRELPAWKATLPEIPGAE